MSGGITPPDGKGHRRVFVPHFANSAGSVAGPDYGPFLRRPGQPGGDSEPFDDATQAEIISIFRDRPVPVPLYRRYDVTLTDTGLRESRTYSVTVPSPGNPEESAIDEAREMWSDEFGSYGDAEVELVEET